MTWHYHCPKCGGDVGVDWDLHSDEVVCPHCQHPHYPPTPGEDHEAHFAGERWPRELEDTVINLRGTTCEVPGCYAEYTTMVPRKPLAAGGRVSVANMIAMCADHARLMGDQDFDEWLDSLPPELRHQQGSEIEITFTEASAPAKAPSGPAPASFAGPGPGHIQSLAGRATLPEDLPKEYKLVVCSPFLAGSPRRLVLDYEWELGADGSGTVVVLAWPANRPPALADGVAGLRLPKASAEIEGAKADSGSNRLKLELPLGSDGLWKAAVLLRDNGGKPALLDFLLAATD